MVTIIDELVLDFSVRSLRSEELKQMVDSLRHLSDKAKIHFWMEVLSKDNMTEFTVTNKAKLQELLFDELTC